MRHRRRRDVGLGVAPQIAVAEHPVDVVRVTRISCLLLILLSKCALQHRRKDAAPRPILMRLNTAQDQLYFHLAALNEEP